MLRAQKTLIKGEQRFVDLENIVVAAADKVFHDNIELVAVGQGKSGFSQQILRFLEGKLQRNGEGQRGGFAGLVVDVAADLGKELSDEVGLIVESSNGNEL